MKKLITILSGLSLLLSQDLNTILTRATSDHPLLNMADQQVINLRQTANYQSSFDDPKLMVTAFPEPIVTANGAQETVLQLSQSFPFFGTLGLKKEMLNYRANALQEDRYVIQNNLLFELTSAYFQLAAVQARQELFTEYKQLLNNFYESALVKYEHALGSQQNVLKAQTEIVSMEDQLIELSIKENTLLAKINQIANADYKKINARFSVEPVDSGQVEINDLAQIKSIRQMQFMQQTELDLVAKESLPMFQVGLQYSIINERSGIVGNKDAIGLQLGLSLPFLSGKYGEKEAAAVAKKMIVDEQLRYQKLIVNQRILEIKQRIRELGKRLELYNSDFISKAELTLSSSLSAYETGELGFLNVLDAERMLLKVRNQAIDIELKLRIAKAELKKEVTVYRSGDKNE